MKDRTGEKTGWTAGWIGGFIWVFVLSLVFLFQGKSEKGQQFPEVPKTE